MKIGVLGLGSIGLRHSRNALALGAAVLGYDPSPERRTLLDQAGGTSTPSREAVFDCDAIVICSPNDAHRDDLLAAIAAGRHCFVEKPIAHAQEGLSAALETADNNRLAIFVGFNLRFHAAVQNAVTLLRQERLGSLLWARVIASAYLPNWRPHQDYRQGYTANPRTGGVLFDDIHEIDLALHLLGPGDVVAAAVRTSRTLDMPVEDIAALTIRHRTDVMSEVHLDYCTPRARREVEIAGTASMMTVDLLTRSICLADYASGTVETLSYPGSFDDDYLAEMRHFFSCIAGKEAPQCSGWSGLEALRLVLAARRLCGLQVD